jgi:hypothetical protein
VTAAAKPAIFMNSCVSKYSCIYLFELPRLRVDKYNIYKYGYTNNLARRNKEHASKYGNDIMLTYHAQVPDFYLKDAENDIRNFFKTANLVYDRESSNELVSIPEEYLPMIAEFYKSTSEKYNISYNSIIEQNELMKRILKI